jgi:hypothetical protein
MKKVSLITIMALTLFAVGQTSQGAVLSSCDQWANYCSGNYCVYSNVWGASGTWSQCITATSTTAWYIDATHPSTSGVKSYANSSYENVGQTIANLATLTSSVSTSSPGAGEYCTAWDIWAPTEVMIWINKYGGVGPWGSYVETATIGGQTWDVYKDGYPGFLTQSNSNGMTVNVKAILDYCVTKGWLSSSNTVGKVQCGFEISGTGGVSRRFTMNSYSVSFTTGGGTTAPTAPSNLTATAASSSQINLAWTDNASNETGFYVERSTASASGFSQIASVGANTTSYQSTGLTASTRYYYRVRAYNSVGNSAYSNTANATTQAGGTTAPTAPSNLTATAASSSQINLAWTDNASNETGFYVERSTASASGFSQIASLGANTTSYQSTGLAASTRYYYRVRAYNSAGNSAYSNTANATTQAGGTTAPTAPSNLTATAASSSQINLAWTDNSSNETGFYVERSTASASGFSQIASVGANTTSYQSTGLAASTRYYYRVRAYNSVGNSAYSNTTNATTQAGGGSCTCAANCSSTTSATAPYTKDGAGTLCIVMTSIPNYVNSWNTTTVNINGTDFTNKYASASSLPAKINGNYYIYYNATVAYAHFEAK